MQSLGARIKQSADLIGGLDALAPKLSGVSRRTLSDWVSDKTEPRATSMAEICHVTGVLPEWLMTGQGDMRRGLPLASASLAAFSRLAHSGAESGGDIRAEMVQLPVYNEVRASAGHGSTPTSEQSDGMIAFTKSYLRDQGANPDRCVIIWAQGDSMHPTIHNGALLIVDRSQTEVTNGCIYVVNISGDLLVKRVRRRLDGRIDLISDNKTYEIETIDSVSLSQLIVIGRVFAVLSRY